MDLTEALVVHAARDALGTTVVDDPRPGGRPRRAVAEAADGRPRVGCRRPTRSTRRSRSTTCASSPRTTASAGSRSGAAASSSRSCSRRPSRRASWRPVFVTGHPVEISPLARVDRTDPWLTERFELFCDSRSWPTATASSTTRSSSASRFEDEQAAKDAGDLEAGTVDEDYLRALEYGMPPTGGLGIGIDRLVMMLAGVETIRDVILFPALPTRRCSDMTRMAWGAGFSHRGGRRHGRSTPGSAGSAGASSARRRRRRSTSPSPAATGATRCGASSCARSG